MMALGVGLPDERLGLVVMGPDEVVDRGLQGDGEPAPKTAMDRFRSMASRLVRVSRENWKPRASDTKSAKAKSRRGPCSK